MKAKTIKNMKHPYKRSHDGHTTITDWGKCRFLGMNRIDWKRSVNKKIVIVRDGEARQFKIMKYISRPSKTAHDAKIVIKNTRTAQVYTVWARDLKQSDIGKLFK